MAENKQDRYKNHCEAMAESSDFQAVAGHFNVDPGINISSEFTRKNYEFFRPSESIPEATTQENYRKIMRICTRAYDKVGVVRSVIDMMSEFGSEGVEIVHPDEGPNNFYKEWQKKVNLPDRAERFLSWLFKAGNTTLTRQYAQIKSDEVKELKKSDKKGRIPIGYTFYDPYSIELIGDYMGALSSDKSYAIRVPITNLQLNKPKNALEQAVFDGLPKEVKDAISGKINYNGAALVPIPKDKIHVAHYKKDDSEIWAKSFIYSILDDIQYNQKLKMAKTASLDGWANVTKIWKLGDHTHDLLPSPALASKLANILTQNVGGGTRDIIWDSAIDLQESYPPIEKLQNFAEDNNNILLGLGVPESLVGGTSKGGDLANNYLGLRNLIKRLECGRRALTNWLEEEISIINEAMGFRNRPFIRFTNSDLHDERTYFDILKNLVDRNILPESRILELLDEQPELSRIGIQREEKMRRDGDMPKKASPFHDPNMETKQSHEIKKITTQNSFKPVGDKNNGRPQGAKDKISRKRGANRFSGPSKAILEASRIYKIVDQYLDEIALNKFNVDDSRKMTTEQKVQLDKAKNAAFASIEPFTNLKEDNIVDIFSNLDDIAIAEFYNAYNICLSEVGLEKITNEQKIMLKLQSYVDIWSGDN